MPNLLNFTGKKSSITIGELQTTYDVGNKLLLLNLLFSDNTIFASGNDLCSLFGDYTMSTYICNDSLSPESDFIATLQNYWNIRKMAYEKINKAIISEYNPIDNYNLTEVVKRKMSEEGTKTGTETLMQTGTDTVTKTGNDLLEKTGNEKLQQAGTDTFTKTGDVKVVNKNDSTNTTTGTDTTTETRNESKTETIKGKDSTTNNKTVIAGISTVTSNAATTVTSTNSVSAYDVATLSEHDKNVTNAGETSQTVTNSGQDATKEDGTFATEKTITDTNGIDTDTTLTHNVTVADVQNISDITTHNTTDTNTKALTDTTTYDTSNKMSYNTIDTSSKDNTDTTTYDINNNNVTTDDSTLTRSGNIGVTTSQQMIESEYTLRLKYSLIELFVTEFIRNYCF